MAGLVKADGFDHYTFAQILRKWTNQAISGSPASMQSGGRIGSTGQYLKVINSGSYTLQQTLPSSIATIIVGFGIRIDTLSGNPPGTGSDNLLVSYRDAGTNQVDLRLLSTTGALRVTRNGTTLGTSSGGLLGSSLWNWLEFKATINNTTGSYEVRLNGVNVLSATGQNTRASSNNSADAVWLFDCDGNKNSCSFDDVVILDPTGASAPFDDFLGDTKVMYMPADGAGTTTQWTPSAGSNYQNVDDSTPNDDTDYNADATVGHIDLYTTANPSPAVPSGATIFGVQVVNCVKKDDAGARVIHNLIKRGATTAEGGDYAPLTSYAFSTSFHATDPTSGTTWAASDIPSIECGVKVTA